MRRLWAWLTSPRTWLYEPELVAAASTVEADIDGAKLRLLSYLDRQADMWPEDRNVEGIELAVDVLAALGVKLQRPAPGEVPVIPGRST